MPNQKNPSDLRRKINIFSDFDGTIFMQDTGHVLVSNLSRRSTRMMERPTHGFYLGSYRRE
ncbi:uncharacterized protein ACHE_40293A [Aspergillus chevalieri]|uniref:Uncharacterized protein n=1 Tax=Aspergillus chevalieri TaxID=182096 RepID=A0A7R7VPL5_ASPCH|nr:uncharacterized protein ACHE_40293A [Aspergillus chevalieri]BCR87729.1 hypothetical protein ACHE_40293A [Aspergillus chevalieri]